MKILNILLSTNHIPAIKWITNTLISNRLNVTVSEFVNTGLRRRSVLVSHVMYLTKSNDVDTLLYGARQKQELSHYTAAV